MPPDDHAWLGRFLSAHGSFCCRAESVEAISLYRSTLGSDGPRYDLLETYPLV